MSLIINHAELSCAENPYEAIIFLVFELSGKKFNLALAIVPLIHYLSSLYLSAAIALVVSPVL